jgi:hypothetical protein
MAFIVRDCVRCGVKNIQHMVVGDSMVQQHRWDLAAACTDCKQISIWMWTSANGQRPSAYDNNTNVALAPSSNLANHPSRIATTAYVVAASVPQRVSDLFTEANECRQMTWYEAAGAMYRKTLDVATKHIYQHDVRLAEREPANALRARIRALGELKILELDIVELADVAALDGNDATHDVDPYTAEEAEALEDLTLDLLDRLFVRPARLAAVKAKQIASGQRPAE